MSWKLLIVRHKKIFKIRKAPISVEKEAVLPPKDKLAPPLKIPS